MPYNIWCGGCGRHIARGVRYNAEKMKVGNYYTTPIYEFRMRCQSCTQYFIIRTDPSHFDYELIDGCTRQEKRWVPTNEDDLIVPTQKVEAVKLASDAMYRLEHGEDDKTKLKDVEPRLAKLHDIQDRMKDDFLANQTLRKGMRVIRTEAKALAAKDKAIKDSAALDINLLPANEQDSKMAALLARYRTVKSMDESQKQKRKSILQNSIFAIKRKKIRKISGVNGDEKELDSVSDCSTSGQSSSDFLREKLMFDRNSIIAKRIAEKPKIGAIVKSNCNFKCEPTIVEVKTDLDLGMITNIKDEPESLYEYEQTEVKVDDCKMKLEPIVQSSLVNLVGYDSDSSG